MLGKKRFARLRSLLTQLNYATKQKIGQKKTSVDLLKELCLSDK